MNFRFLKLAVISSNLRHSISQLLFGHVYDETINSPNLRRSISPWIFLVMPLMYVSACGPTTETTVIGGQARALETDDEDEDEELMTDEDVRVLRIGEANRIRSFDPLFAINTATKRTINLLYEGLVRFDENDDIVPAAAQRWEISGDSLTYTFHLRNDLFFHDDESFTQGRGRRVNSRDIIRVFERMASRDVPSNGAELFKNNLEGFEAYFLEQREIYFTEDREIRSISGIEAPNDRTVVFRLLEPSDRFLEKLASPFAVIYPSEAFRFRDSGLHRHAVGTGPFAFERSSGDSLHVLIRNNSYYGRDEQGRQLPRTRRVEIFNITDEGRLNNLFIDDQLDMIIDLGPQNIQNYVNERNELREEYRNSYRLDIRSNPDPVIIRYNADNRFGLGRADAASTIRNTDQDVLIENSGIPSLEIVYIDENFAQSNIARVYNRFGVIHNNDLRFAYNQDQLPGTLGRQIYQLMDNNLRVAMMQRRAFSRDIFLYLDYLTVFSPGEQPGRQPQEILRLTSDRYLLYNNSMDRIQTNSLSWWINLNHMRTRPQDAEEQAVIPVQGSSAN